ncbi:MAG: hypothetical protein HY294_02895 [Candidatus Rokubacteria bacterium]|nr:hypothetical protein [Candidatus Rokubacteria bacterium]MBI3824923.1 hypothetical protein [Candidatus Rokubacteria bacterium]
MLRFLIGLVAGAVAVWTWREEIQKFMDDKGREGIRRAQSAAGDVINKVTELRKDRP